MTLPRAQMLLDKIIPLQFYMVVSYMRIKNKGTEFFQSNTNVFTRPTHQHDASDSHTG